MMKLTCFQRPSRYIGGEHNSVSRKDVGKDGVRCALCFPDVYEVGMSHLGVKILYEIVNSLPYASAERAFSPWIDLEAYMKREGVVLSSLESGTPLKNFDIVGFSLQYELSYTSVLNMLDLGGIPLLSEERRDEKRHAPLVVAGGPCTVNPAPMAAFLDAFLIGDGEEAMVELIDTVRQWKIHGDGRRETLLREISKLIGFYVPSVHSSECRIKRRIIADLDHAPYPLKPVVPYTTIVHDRVTIEVSRGCSMGCRFCQAGMIYRPVRERRPETVLHIAEESLRNTGYEEVSFTSLSAGDYRGLLPLVRAFNARFGESKIAMSLPSLRVGAINRDVLKEIKSIRKTGFTIAPEAATERLRSVINKDFSDDDYERALKALFEEGWLNLKLYFMIGLPTERDEDLEAIREMALRALTIAKRNTGRFVNISVTISPFVPKAQTPFQWCGQIGLDGMRAKLGYLRAELSSKKFKYKGHNEETSLLEAVFARGNERLAGLIQKAWELGCRLDGWSEVFDFKKWREAMEATGIDGASYAERSYGDDERLPWDVIDCGLKKDFLRSEYEKVLTAARTEDCRKKCTACGLGCVKGNSDHAEAFLTSDGWSEKKAYLPESSSVGRRAQAGTVRVRVRFSKSGKLSCLSHLELVSVLLRAMRRAGIAFDHSKGFHPSPLVSFGPPLNVGVAGEQEYFDVVVLGVFDGETSIRRLNSTMPEGITIHRMTPVLPSEPSLNNFIKRYVYRISRNGGTAVELDGGQFSALPGQSLIVRRDGQDIDLSPCVEDIRLVKSSSGGETAVVLTLCDHDSIKIRLGEITEAILGEKITTCTVVRTALYGWSNGWREPL